MQPFAKFKKILRRVFRATFQIFEKLRWRCTVRICLGKHIKARAIKGFSTLRVILENSLVCLLVRKQFLSESVSPEEECGTENGSADFNRTKTTQQILVGKKVLNI